MIRKTTLLLGICLVFGAAAQSGLVRAADKPNILFVFADDQCFDTIAALSDLDIDTPHLDRLVRRGTTFTHAYNMGSWSGAVCVASRTMLVTGRNLWRAHAVYDATDAERQAGRLWPQLMAQQGYKTYFTGKWHIKTDAAKVFDVAAHIRGGMPQQTPAGYDRPHEDEPDAWSPSDPRFGGFWEGGRHWSEVVADDAETFLADDGRGDQPFFMYVAFNAPHDPRQSPQQYIDRYPLSRVALPENFLPEYPHKDKIGCSPSLRDEHLAPFPRTPYAVKVNRQEYFALISHMDTQIGRILDALEASGQADNTYIFFTADHGLAVGRHGLFGKQNMYDHSLRVPFVVVGPDVPADRRINTPVYLQDVMPTALELAGATPPEHIDFHSLLPLLRGTARESAYPAIYGAYLQLQRALIHDGYKLIVYPQAGVSRLYHLESDPLEMTDLADDSSHAERRQALFQRLTALQRELGDALDLTPATNQR